MRGSIARDSLWLRQKMARLPVPKGDVASADAAQGAPSGTSLTQRSCVVRETHIAARLKNPDQRERERSETRYRGAPSMSSAELRPRRGVGKQLIKLDVFELAIGRPPYFCKKTEGHRRNSAPQFKYSHQPLGMPIYEKILSDVSTSHGRTVTEVFGTLEGWAPEWDNTLSQCPHEEAAQEREMREPGFVIVGEVVDIQSLVRYSNLRVDRRRQVRYSNLRVDRRRQDLADYINLHRTKGWLDEKGLSHIEQRYWEKLIACRPLCRMYGDRLSIQNITTEARAAACSSFYIDVDFRNAHASILSNSIRGLAMGNFRNFIAWRRLWREAVASYHICDDAEAERTF